MAMIPVPAGHVAAIVTDLEMRARPRPRPVPESTLALVRWPQPTLAAYRTLFARVGTPWLWYSRLVMTDQALRAIIGDPAVEVFAVVDRAGVEVGMLELDFRKAPDCELGYFALVPELTGAGHGRWLMAQALVRAWRPGVECVWVHTCSLDHPSALNFYRAQGFVAINREVEIFPDPRLSGLLPPGAAPQIPVVGAS